MLLFVCTLPTNQEEPAGDSAFNTDLVKKLAKRRPGGKGVAEKPKRPAGGAAKKRGPRNWEERKNSQLDFSTDARTYQVGWGENGGILFHRHVQLCGRVCCTSTTSLRVQ